MEITSSFWIQSNRVVSFLNPSLGGHVVIDKQWVSWPWVKRLLSPQQQWLGLCSHSLVQVALFGISFGDASTDRIRTTDYCWAFVPWMRWVQSDGSWHRLLHQRIQVRELYLLATQPAVRRKQSWSKLALVSWSTMRASAFTTSWWYDTMYPRNAWFGEKRSCMQCRCCGVLEPPSSLFRWISSMNLDWGVDAGFINLQLTVGRI